MNRAKIIALVIFSGVIAFQLIRSVQRWNASSGERIEYHLPADKSLDKPLEPKRNLTSEEETLLKSAEKGDRTAVAQSLAQGTNPNAKDQTGKTALMWAVTSGDLATVKLLLDHGADLSAKDDQGHTASYLAVMRHQMEIGQFLLNKEAKPAIKNKRTLNVKKK